MCLPLCVFEAKASCCDDNVARLQYRRLLFVIVTGIDCVRRAYALLILRLRPPCGPGGWPIRLAARAEARSAIAIAISIEDA